MEPFIRIEKSTDTWFKKEKFLPEEVCYYNIYKRKEFYHFKYQLETLKSKIHQKRHTVIFLCIGSDRATGDCFGPLVGEALLLAWKRNFPLAVPKIYGTLEKPIHAVNLENTIWQIYRKYRNPYIIAIDASLGIKEHIGFITLGAGPLFPGIGVKKELPEIGDAAITGIVNVNSKGNQNTLQTTRLSIVYKLADFVSRALIETFLA